MNLDKLPAGSVTLKAIPGYQYYYATREGDIYSITPAHRKKFFDTKKLTLTPIPGKNMYSAGPAGEIKMIKLKPGYNLTNDYLFVYLSMNGKKKKMYVHRLVLMTFRGPFPEGKETNHKDLNPRNNKLSNLHFITRRDNILHERAARNKKYDYTKSQPGDPF